MSRATRTSSPSVTDPDKKPTEKDLLLIFSHLFQAAEHSLGSTSASQLAQNTASKTLSTTLLFSKQANRVLFCGGWGVIFFLIKVLDFALRGRHSGEKLKEIFTPEKTRLFISFLFETIGGALLFSQKNKNADDRDYVAIAFAIGLFLFGGFIGANGDPRKIKDAVTGALTPTSPQNNNAAQNTEQLESTHHNKKVSREETIAQFFACRRGLITSGTTSFSVGLGQNTLAISEILLYSAVFDILCGSIVIAYSAGCMLVDCCSSKTKNTGKWQLVERNILAGKKAQFLFAALLMLAGGVITLRRRYEDNHNDTLLEFAGLCTYLAGTMTVLATASPQLAAILNGLQAGVSMVGAPSFLITRPTEENTAPYGEGEVARSEEVVSAQSDAHSDIDAALSSTARPLPPRSAPHARRPLETHTAESPKSSHA